MQKALPYFPMNVFYQPLRVLVHCKPRFGGDNPLIFSYSLVKYMVITLWLVSAYDFHRYQTIDTYSRIYIYTTCMCKFCDL